MNEIIFIVHAVIVAFFAFWASRFGRAGLNLFIGLCAIFANLFVIKQIDLCGLAVTASDAFSVGAILGLSLLQHSYGKAAALKAVRQTFFALIFFYLMVSFNLFYKPNRLDFSHGAFALLFSFNSRIIFASIATTFVSQRVDVAIFKYLQRFFKDGFMAKFFGAALISQFVDTLMFSFLGLYGIAPLKSVIPFSYLVKIIALALSLMVVRLLKPKFEAGREL